ncbi:MAG TPA: response regulator transcription factor [Ktedonobacterales bacterium]
MEPVQPARRSPEDGQHAENAPATTPATAESQPARIRILVADDHPIFRAGLRALLDAQPDMRVVGEAGDGAEAVKRARELRPDVVLLDLSMPGMDGLTALRRMQAEGIQSRPLVVTMHAENEYLFQVLESGGYGYVLKQAVDTDLFEAIRTVAAGEVFLYPSATTLLLSRYLDTRQEGTDSGHEGGLSEREREVLVLTAEGYSGQEIGDQLALSAKTVETYRTRVMRKLNLHHRADLVQYALRTGLLRSHDGP